MRDVVETEVDWQGVGSGRRTRLSTIISLAAIEL